MIRKKEKAELGVDRWFFLISGVLVAVLLTTAVLAIVFLSRYIFQSFSPISDDEQNLEYNLEGYRSLNLPAGSEV